MGSGAHEDDAPTNKASADDTSHDAPTNDDASADAYQADLETARTWVAALLDARGVTSVVHVDDKHPDAGEEEVDVDEIRAALTVGALTIESLAAADATAHIVTDDAGLVPQEVLLDRLTRADEEFGASDLRALTSAARTLGQRPVGATELTADDSTDLDTLAEIHDLLPSTVHYCPMRATVWQKEKAALLKSDTPLLVLFDRDLSDEKGMSSTSGDRLLAETIGARNPHVYAGMLTHAAANQQAEDDIATRISDDQGASLLDVVVISKTTLRTEPLQLPRKLKTAFLTRALTTLRDAVETGYGMAHEVARQAIGRLQPHTLSDLVAAADHEGSHGAANLIRIATTAQRRELERVVRTSDGVSGSLDEIRRLHDAGPTGTHLPAVDVAQLQRADRYDDGAYLAALHLPPEPGDIFEVVDAQSLLNNGDPVVRRRRYILLVQACDMVVRANGLRTGQPKLLTLSAVETTKTIRAFDHELTYFDDAPPDKTWAAIAMKRVQAPVQAIDACALSDDGTAVIALGAKPPAGLTPGWLLVFNKLQEWARTQLDAYRSLTEGMPDESDWPGGVEARKHIARSLTGTPSPYMTFDAAFDLATERVAFGLRRIRRVSDSDARVLLASAGNYTARPAAAGPLVPSEPHP